MTGRWNETLKRHFPFCLVWPLLNMHSTGSLNSHKKEEIKEEMGKGKELTFDCWSRTPYRRIFRSLAAEARSMMAAGSAILPLMDSSSEVLKCTYQNKDHRTQSENTCQWRGSLSRTAIMPFFWNNYSSLFKQSFKHVATQ